MQVFFCKYNDPAYVKMEKLEIMIRLASDRNIDQVLLEFKEYATEVDVEFVRKVTFLNSVRPSLTLSRSHGATCGQLCSPMPLCMPDEVACWHLLHAQLAGCCGIAMATERLKNSLQGHADVLSWH